MRPVTRRTVPDLGGSGAAPPPDPPTASLTRGEGAAIWSLLSPGGSRSRLVRSALAKESLRPENQDQDQDREDDRVRPARRDVLVAPRGEEADQKSAESGPGHAANAAQHGRGEGAEAGLVAHPPHPDVVVEALDEAGRSRERT